MTIVETIKELESVGSRIEKERILREGKSDLLLLVLEATYNSFKRYYINSQIALLVGSGTGVLEYEKLKSLLDRLSSREVTGHAALGIVEEYASTLDQGNAEILKRIIKKDLRCGVSESTINKVFPDLIPTFDVQLAAKSDRMHKMSWPAYIEPKLDGMRCIVLTNGIDTVEFLSRAGKPITTLDYMTSEVIKLSHGNAAMFDGEVMSSTFNSTMSDVKRKTKKNEDAVLYLFDMMPLDDFNAGECKTKQCDRKTSLMSLFEEDHFQFLKLNLLRIVESEDQAREVFARFRDAGYEGAIVKNMTASYQCKRNDAWIKLKPKLDSLDLVVVGVDEGTGKNQGRLGAFVVDYKGKQCRVGSGFSDEQRIEFWESRNEMIGYIIEVEGMEETPDGAIRHPVFIRVRSYCGAKF